MYYIVTRPLFLELKARRLILCPFTKKNYTKQLVVEFCLVSSQNAYSRYLNMFIRSVDLSTLALPRQHYQSMHN